MGWEDRDYYRGRPSGSRFTGGLMWLLTGSVPLGTWFGIRVRMHSSLVIFMAITLLFAETRGGMGAKNALTSMIILFFSVLLHEFGHCFGARWVGGSARDILMWPLGGLAFVEPPRRPWPSFLTTAAGPAVNVLLCLVTGLGIFAIYAASDRSAPLPWFPFRDGLASYVPYDSTLAYYLFWIFTVNYGLLMFNLLLVFYPFDGGRMVQELLWVKVGYYKSMMFATRIGMIGAVIAAMVGLVTSFMLVVIAIFGFITCYRQYQQLREMGPGEWADSTDYSAAYIQPDRKPPKGPGYFARRKAQRDAESEVDEQKRVDEILAKVSASGMSSLTRSERNYLKKATENQRKRDEAKRTTRKRALEL